MFLFSFVIAGSLPSFGSLRPGYFSVSLVFYTSVLPLVLVRSTLGIDGSLFEVLLIGGGVSLLSVYLGSYFVRGFHELCIELPGIAFRLYVRLGVTSVRFLVITSAGLCGGEGPLTFDVFSGSMSVFYRELFPEVSIRLVGRSPLSGGSVTLGWDSVSFGLF